jgi:hypothetical protein
MQADNVPSWQLDYALVIHQELNEEAFEALERWTAHRNTEILSEMLQDE